MDASVGCNNDTGPSNKIGRIFHKPLKISPSTGCPQAWNPQMFSSFPVAKLIHSYIKYHIFYNFDESFICQS